MAISPTDIHAQAVAELDGFVSDMLQGSCHVSTLFFQHMQAITDLKNKRRNGLMTVHLPSRDITALEQALIAAERLSQFATYPAIERDARDNREHHLSIDELKNGSTRIENRHAVVTKNATAAITLMRDEATQKTDPFYERLARFKALAAQLGGEENITIPSGTKERLMHITHIIHALNVLLPTPRSFADYNDAVGTFHRVQGRPTGPVRQGPHATATAEA